MRKQHPKFALTALAAALAAAYGATAAAESDPALDDLIKPSSSVSIGVGTWNKDRPQMGIYDGMRKDDAKLLFDADVRKRDDETGTWLTLSVRNLGLDTREIRGEYLEQGKFGAAVEYSEFQTRAPYTINSNVTGIGTNAQALGANIPNTAIGSGANYQFGLDRDRLGFSFYRNLGLGLDLKVKLTTEDKKGERITSNGSSIFVADLIDWTTHKAEATLDYSKDKLHLSGGYYGSWYVNNNSAGFVQGGAATVAGGNRMTQPLDNQAHQAFLSGHYGFTPTTKGSFKIAYTHGTQNETLPTSQISSNSYANIPSLQGKVDTTLVQVGLSTRPLSRLSVTANFRYNDVKDKTPQYASVTRTDNGGTLAINSTPYSYKTTSAKLEGTYNLGNGYAAMAGIDYLKQNRSVFTVIGGAAYNPYVPMRAETDELTYTLQLRKSLSETLNGSVSYAYGDKSGSDYQAIAGNAGVAFVSPVNTADRERDKIRLALDWAPSEALDVQMNLEKAVDKYGNNVRSQGLHRGEADLLSLDANYRISDDWKAAGWYSVNTNDVHLVAYGPNAAPTNLRTRKQNDTGHALGFSLTGQVTAKTAVGAELTWANDKTHFDQSNADGSATGVLAPDITSRITRFKLFADYALDKTSNVRVDLVHEKWHSNDWLWTYQDGKPWQFGTATDGTTVITTPKQNATFIGARYVYKFR